MYRPISDYAIIGNRHSCALVARNGSIDWCCLPYLDSQSVFAGILDAKRGGRWQIAPAGESAVTRKYIGSSAVLETEFRGAGGSIVVTDFMPIRAGEKIAHSVSAHAIVRRVRCTEGAVDVAVEWMPRPSYARADVTLTRQGGAVVAQSRKESVWLSGLPDGDEVSFAGGAARATIPLRVGEELNLICTWNQAEPLSAKQAAGQYLHQTLNWWRNWAAGCQVEAGADQWAEMVLRSGIVLKLLTNERSGAIAAAPTTSLPEEIGGIRNWDYRFCWVRDSSMISRALITLGEQGDAVAFLDFIERAAQQHPDPSRVQILYDLQGGVVHAEYALGHLDGYANSMPVRVGNGAASQRQLDVYGEIFEAAWDLLRAGHLPSPARWAWLRSVADYVCEVWQLPDRGIWEVRGPERHFTYSKLMCWVALDRALKMAKALRAPKGTARWRRVRRRIRAAILDHGFDAERGSFVQCFDSKHLDASSLLIPMIGFLPATDPRVLATLNATLSELTEEGLVHRYRADSVPDGVGGGEGAFGICTFWLCHALSLAGRTAEAEDIFTGMLARANDVGLYAEEIDPHSGAFLGNFPQAFTHIGLINSARAVGLHVGAGTRAA